MEEKNHHPHYVFSLHGDPHVAITLARLSTRIALKEKLQENLHIVSLFLYHSIKTKKQNHLQQLSLMCIMQYQLD